MVCMKLLHGLVAFFSNFIIFLELFGLYLHYEFEFGWRWPCPIQMIYAYWCGHKLDAIMEQDLLNRP